MNSIRFEKIADIPSVTDGYSVITKSVANDGALLFLSIEESGIEAVRETEASGAGIFPKTRMNEVKRFRLTICRANSSLQTIDLPELDLTFPLIDVFPDGKVLIASPRCSWRGHDDYDLNGVIFDPKTAKMSRILLGDGINSAYVDALGRIWVAYFDEGVIGNFGWRDPGPAPIGDAGLVCFSEAGKKIWEYPDSANRIVDCYALNVSGAEAAIFFYTEFPICRISNNFELAHWETQLRGCHQFAISKSAVLFSGQYHDPPDAAYLGQFGRDSRLSIQQVRLSLPGSSNLVDGQLLGRGKYMYFFDSLAVYRASLD